MDNAKKCQAVVLSGFFGLARRRFGRGKDNIWLVCDMGFGEMPLFDMGGCGG
ncbi:hypothetical protein RR11_2768 [Ruegeria sp. R11]|nr:hypothetical protein RR11_2768 [Ruegeria sp. R11]